MKSVDPPAGRFEVSRLLRTTLGGRCPACGKGRLFVGLYAMRASCEACGVGFERNPGNWTGAVVVTYGVTTLLSIVLGLALVLRFGFAPFVPWVLIGTAVCVALVLHRPAKAWWVWLLWATGLVFRDEGADPGEDPAR